MAIALEKARKVLKEYNDSGFNAVEALPKAGYAVSTATHKSKEIINSALKVVAKEQLKNVVASSNPMDSMFGYLGITAKDVAQEFMKIVRQDKDMTNKLKALQPLLATQGIKWNEEKTLNAPTLNLTIKDNTVSNKSAIATPTPIDMAQQSQSLDYVAQSTMSANLDVAVDSDIVEEPLTEENNNVEKELTPLSPSVLAPEKEVQNPTQNFEVLDTIDKKEEVLPFTITENIAPTPIEETIIPTQNEK